MFLIFLQVVNVGFIQLSLENGILRSTGYPIARKYCGIRPVIDG